MAGWGSAGGLGGRERAEVLGAGFQAGLRVRVGTLAGALPKLHHVCLGSARRDISFQEPTLSAHAHVTPTTPRPGKVL